MFGAGAQWGYYSDSETGRLLLTSRYYDPGTGRFLTRDPIGYAGGINLYGYCGNGPVGFADPLGLEGEETGCPGEPGVFDPSPAAQEGNEDPEQEVETLDGAPVVVPQFPATPAAVEAEGGVRLDPSVFRTLGEPVPDEGGGPPGTVGRMDPWRIRYTQDSVNWNFRKGNQNLGDTVDQLRNIHGYDVDEPIAIFERDGKLYSLDNRRVLAYRAAGRTIPYRWATDEDLALKLKKHWTTKDDGTSVFIKMPKNWRP